ncbi:hypothetical protein BFW01_g8926 [Lasiodiplodia theobromae]|nr:hypothetical protein BFW01_g8926 [Lasiodiplodia theobromae]
MADPQARITLPGFGLPVDALSTWAPGYNKKRFPHAISDYFATDGLTVRERRMLDFINKITDKPGWDSKVFDDDIVSKWRTEACRYDESLKDEYLSQAMFNYCISELQDKASLHREKGLVAVMDADATVVKSDSAVSDDLRQSLIRAVHPLEDVPDRLKDWHPGSRNQVLDLVHPSLFPLVFGRSRVLPSGRVPLKDCAQFTGMGEIMQELKKCMDGSFHAKHSQNAWGGYQKHSQKAWGGYQWLPAQVDFAPDGQPRITSYINNLHPQAHADLYTVLEKFVDRSIPLWNECLSWFHDRRRIKIDGTSNEDWFLPEGVKWSRPTSEDGYQEEDSDEEEMDDEQWAQEHGFEDEYEEWFEEHRILKQKEPSPFVPFSETLQRPHLQGISRVDLRSTYKDSGLQVIFKLANIHLTPENPEYNGSKWHIEGALNEHICATAIYYYDSENIEPSHLAFQQSISPDEILSNTTQSEWSSACAYYGIEYEGTNVQSLGQVATPQGRLLAFPNVMQHRVSSFRLADPTKPGHRKILAMFLVDPHTPVLSTANVPPQRRDWWAAEVRKVERFAALPEELFEAIIEGVDDFPFSWDEAELIRERLMKERMRIQSEAEDAMYNERFNFCEH